MMSNLLFLIPAFPLFGSLVLGLSGLSGKKLSQTSTAWIGVGSVALSALISLLFCGQFIASAPADRLYHHAYEQTLWTWMEVGGFRPEIRFRLDALSIVMTMVVSFVGFLIHLYSVEFMSMEGGYSRFFAYMNLFVAAMLTLVLADDLLLLYLGWEGVGLCSYLLIGFWYQDPANGRAARKAFFVTRIGDAALAIGLFFLFTHLGTLGIQSVLHQAMAQWPQNSTLPLVASALLLGGAVGKSAQLPLQTWLPDAMAGPTPVSALIHAATMVTAGVYLIARMHSVFELAPPVQEIVGAIGALTLLLAACSALTQTDIKRVLAYSTISQIGYMFLALGAGAYSAAIFHFMTHAFFKALLFLSAGAVTLSLEHEHDILKMGGLRKQIPIVFWTFLIGAASLSAFPWITAGFYSKDLILIEAASSSLGSPWFFAAGLLGAFLTSIYSFRLVFLVFLGPTRTSVRSGPGILMLAPLVVLAALSLFGGWIRVPEFTAADFDSAPVHGKLSGWVSAVSAGLSIFGIGLAYLLYGMPSRLPARIAATPLGCRIRSLWLSGWGFDWLYDRAFVRPFYLLSSISRDDRVDFLFNGIARINLMAHQMLSRSQTGRLRWYATAIAGGAAVLLALTEFL